MIDEGYKVPAMATALDRSKTAIMARKTKLGLSLRIREQALQSRARERRLAQRLPPDRLTIVPDKR
jgi:hypothetical protein